MLSLLRSEWYQVKKSLPIKIIFLLTLLASLVFGNNLTDPDLTAEIQELGRSYQLFGGGSLCQNMQDGAACLLFASLLAGWLIGAAFENRTLQEAVSYGKGRTNVYLAKMFTFVSVCTGICLVYWFGCSLPLFLKNGLGTEEMVGNLCHINYLVGMLLAGILAYASLFLICGLIGFLCRKAGMTMGVCFAGVLFGGNLLANVLPESMIKIMNYTPMGLYKQVLKTDVCWPDIYRTALVAFIWMVLILGIGLWGFQKTELK